MPFEVWMLLLPIDELLHFSRLQDLIFCIVQVSKLRFREQRMNLVMAASAYLQNVAFVIFQLFVLVLAFKAWNEMMV